MNIFDEVIYQKKLLNIELKPTENEDHYILLLNGVDVTGEQERSVFRHIIETIDNGIEVGI